MKFKNLKFPEVQKTWDYMHQCQGLEMSIFIIYTERMENNAGIQTKLVLDFLNVSFTD